VELKCLSEFNKDKQKSDGLCSECKDCKKKRRENKKEYNRLYRQRYYLENRMKLIDDARERRSKSNDLYYSVYLIPEENYVGITKNLSRRFSEHKRSGKDMRGATVMHMYKNKYKALDKEREYHLKGYRGNKKLNK
jgi:predicted GIY-YIG superfamily endonuclease